MYRGETEARRDSRLCSYAARRLWAHLRAAVLLCGVAVSPKAAGWSLLDQRQLCAASSLIAEPITVIKSELSLQGRTS